jgi:hypothetical protein
MNLNHLQIIRCTTGSRSSNSLDRPPSHCSCHFSRSVLLSTVTLGCSMPNLGSCPDTIVSHWHDDDDDDDDWQSAVEAHMST